MSAESPSRVRLRIDLAYDGTEFHGWAAQPGLRTVQGEVEAALQVLSGQKQRAVAQSIAPVRLTVAGRTDAGVHARGQVAHVDIYRQLAPRMTVARLNGVLKKMACTDIAVHAIREVDPVFDARFAALSRCYVYRLRDAGSIRDPLTARFVAELPVRLELAAMRRVSEALLGLQDFTSFCQAREGATAVRTLLRFDWEQHDDGTFAATVEADAFCHSMVRSLVGGVAAVGSARITPEELLTLRDARTRSSRFSVAPAHGLCLEAVSYPPDAELRQRVEQTRAKRQAVVHPATNI